MRANVIVDLLGAEVEAKYFQKRETYLYNLKTHIDALENNDTIADWEASKTLEIMRVNLSRPTK